MELSFINTDEIDFFYWFMQSLKKIYDIQNVPSTSAELKTFSTEDRIIHAFCDTEFNNWHEDPMATDFCKGNVFRFQQKDSPFVIKFYVAIKSSMIGPLNTGILSVADDDPNQKEWIAQLKTIIPRLDESPRNLGRCTQTCEVLKEYWDD